MQKQNRKFLQFNGKSLLFQSFDGTYWVAIKPICQALGVDYRHNLERIKEHPILAQLCGSHPLVAADNRLREMFCLPEKVIYGWLFSIRSDSPALLQYQWECYQVLYDHFHGPLTERLQVLHTKSQAQLEIEHWQDRLKQTEEYRQLQQAQSRVRGSGKQLNQLDKALTEQLDIFQ